ncbi:MAG: cytochrome c biogenesis protein CcsA [Alcaligenaceae bacterium]|nr:cytochrome c biogenesis protein CcsA [Alcaligenaceae bacterium]
MSLDIVLHYLSALAYLLLAASIWYPLWKNQELEQHRGVRHWALLLILLLHGGAVHYAMLYSDHIRLNWALSLSLTIWIGMIIYWIESNFVSIKALLLPLGLSSAVGCLLTAFFPTADSGIKIYVNSEIFRIHLIISLFAYSVIALATIQALVTTAVDRYLHKPHDFDSEQKFLNRLVDAQPPLLLQERLLFRLIWIGFGLLSLSIITGSWVSMRYYDQLLPQDHKTFFTLLAWIVFAFLLAGRTIWGWRGRIALRWNLLGFFLLMLAYTGSRFVFEMILGR